MKNKLNYLIVFALLLLTSCSRLLASDSMQLRMAPAPLFRDPIYDGAADPVVVNDKNKQEW